VGCTACPMRPILVKAAGATTSAPPAGTDRAKVATDPAPVGTDMHWNQPKNISNNKLFYHKV
jgi:hypothetical protein